MSQNQPESKVVTKPPVFQDAKKNSWTINLTIGLLNRVLENNQVDLAPDNNDASPILGLLFQRNKLCDVAWTCCKAQADEKGVTRDDFLDAIDGNVIMKCWEALVDAIAFFIQSRSQKLAEAFLEAVEAGLKVLGMGAELTIKSIKSQQTDQALKKAAERIGQEMQNEIQKALEESAMS